VERGVYFDAWFPRQHCYHPSLPPRRLRMVEDLVELRATALVWSALGGGSISLPYLEEEAYAEIDPRFRFYGFLNDSEFIAACDREGIKVFGIVFEVQGWEFPVELSEDESRVLALNEPRGTGKPGWIGLREFTQNRYPKLWRPFEHYFPGGLRNSDGEPVSDLLEECCSRDIEGRPCHAHWVECPDREHYCYTMDRNNPVWRAYLEAIIRIQIDAGVHGVQLDEAELPITSMQYGGCFCRDCMKGFREHLQGLPAEELPEELRGEDLASFHYGDFLRGRGHDFKERREEAPLFWEYMRFQRAAITRYFTDLADYARSYARSKGREVLVSGNFFNLFDHYYALEPAVDLVITEMRNTRYRQPAWYRYVAGFAPDKPTIVVENPYGGVVPELIEMLGRGRGYDLFRLSLYEAAALGVNMSVPYGAWMGSEIEDSFNPPHELCVEIQSFLAEHEHLAARRSASETAIVYSIESLFQERRDVFSDNRYNVSAGEAVRFWDICESLSSASQPYDVVFFPDGTLRADTLTAEDLARYRTVVLPDCRHLTEAQADALAGYLAGGGHVLVLGPFAENLDGARRRALLDEPGLRRDAGADFEAELLDGGPQVVRHDDADVALNLHRLEDGVALHLVHYDYDADADRVAPLPRLRLDLRLDGAHELAATASPAGELAATLERDGDLHRLELRDVPLYSILHLRRMRY
jgi:hypothetical protein